MKSFHAIATTAAIALLTGPGAAQRAAAQQVETIDVVGTTPLGSELDADKVAANVQTATAEELRERGAVDLADFMRRTFGSVFVNDAQSNPLQPDIQYRGFVGSPLLGLPQGLAIYQDGVRLNEPFGDTVNWALIPESAIDTVYLLPGSNPLFGLNTLGGAIAVDTKDGLTTPGTRAELSAGSFGRVDVEAETGGALGDDIGYYLTLSRFAEDGWREYSPSEARQLFGKLSAQGESSHVDVSLTYADTDLVGNGAAPADLLEFDREAVFTRPDRTQNRLGMLNVFGQQTVTDRITLTGNVYVRRSDTRTLNGDDSDFEACANDPGLVCEVTDDGAQSVVLDENATPIPSGDEVEGATVNRTSTDQNSLGFSMQATLAGRPLDRDNQLTIGIAHDESEVYFASSTELGALDDTRQAIPGGYFIGDAFTELAAATENTGVFVTDTWTLGDGVALTLSGRFNRTAIDLEDRLGDALNGQHRFERFNPAAGLTREIGHAATFYASYSEANRAPSPVELTCADEDDPCRLPNAFVADPPLEQVVAKTFETGVRGRSAHGTWHAGVFRTTNEDDILFISAGALTNEGFFDNVGKTRRDGIELNVAGGADERLGWSLDYTYLDASFREAFDVASPNNPAAVDGEIAVEAGDRLPLIPRQLLKAGLRFAASSALTIGADVLAASGVYYRGDEGNLVDGVDGYALLNLRAEYRIGARMSVFANIDNVLDTEYETFGVFGEADEVLGQDFDDRRFLGPGAPRAAWIGIRVEL